MASVLRRFGLVAALAALGAAGAATIALAQPGPQLTARIATSGVAPPCAEPAPSTYISVEEGPVMVLFEGTGFRPGDTVDLDWVGSTRDPADLHLTPEGFGIGRATVSADGSFRCTRSLNLFAPATDEPRYDIILGFPSSFDGRSEATVAAAPKALLDRCSIARLPRLGTGDGREPAPVGWRIAAWGATVIGVTLGIMWVRAWRISSSMR